MTRRPLLPLFALIVVVPLALLSFFAVRLLYLENEALTARRALLRDERLKLAEAVVAARLQILGTELLAQAHNAYADGGASALGKLVHEREVKHVFVFKNSVLVSPPKDEAPPSVLLTERASSLATNPEAASGNGVGVVVGDGHGDYTLLRCRRWDDGLDVCIVLNPSDVTNVLRSALGLVARSVGLSRVRLIAPDHRLIGLQDTMGVGEAAVRPLDGALQGWKLEAADPTEDDDTLSRSIMLYVIGGSLVAGWIAMVWGLQRAAMLETTLAARRASTIAHLAHDLRTPLANLQLHVDLLQRNPGDGDAVLRYGAVLSSEIGRLAQLAENAISVAKGGMNKRRLEVAVPDDSVRDVVGRFTPILVESGCAVVLACNASAPCCFDKTSWEACLINLIDNARKYAPGAPIEVATSQTAGEVRMDVTDHGPGIAPKDAEQIFEPLERGSGAAVAGFGLGLAAVRTLAQQNGGACWVEAAQPGARFVVIMKVGPVPAEGHRC